MDPGWNDTVTAAPTSSLPGALAPGALVDRFVLLGQVGAGGMGVVYKAYDPELDRHVAIKILRSRRDDPSRLLREAQAIARLSSPNVVAVHDVGRIDDTLFVAMEFVSGQTLKQWLEEERKLSEIVRAFAQVARGLAAGHGKGIVHRDVKPSNAVVGEDGIVRVLDFGLARSVGPEVGEDDLAPAREPGLHGSLTVTGAVMGTPRYMAPEQFAGGPVDARTDQFAFCVALYEAVVGKEPFAADGLEGLAGAVTTGALRPIGKGEAPPWLAAVLRCGLATAPEQRFASMDDLRRELERDRRRPLRTAGLLVGVTALAGLAAMNALPGQRAVAPCAGAGDRADEVWDDERRQALRRAFAQVAPDRGAETADRVIHRVDAYLGDWRAMRVDACEANRVRADKSDELFDRRSACLARRLGEVRAVTEVLTEASDARTVEDARSAATTRPRRWPRSSSSRPRRRATRRCSARSTPSCPASSTRPVTPRPPRGTSWSACATRRWPATITRSPTASRVWCTRSAAIAAAGRRRRWCWRRSPRSPRSGPVTSTSCRRCGPTPAWCSTRSATSRRQTPCGSPGAPSRSARRPWGRRATSPATLSTRWPRRTAGRATQRPPSRRSSGRSRSSPSRPVRTVRSTARPCPGGPRSTSSPVAGRRRAPTSSGRSRSSAIVSAPTTAGSQSRCSPAPSWRCAAAAPRRRSAISSAP